MTTELQIETAVRVNKTVLKNCFYQPPFKVVDITENKQAGALHLMLMNASPGVLDGDAYHLQVTLAAHSELHLHTQSYQRLFRMKTGARQRLNVQLHTGSSFIYLPHPTVPHEGSNFTSLNTLWLADKCTLVWGDVLTCGRKENGEVFRFSNYHTVTDVFVKGKLAIRDNVLVQPAVLDPTVLGQLEGFTHQATLLFLNETVTITTLTDCLHDWLLLQPHLCFGITTLPVNGLLVRLLGNKAEHLHGVLKKLAQLIIAQLPEQSQAPFQTHIHAH